MMKKLISIIFLILPLAASGQSPETWQTAVTTQTPRANQLPETGQAGTDTLIQRPQLPPTVDSTLIGRSIYDVLPYGVKVERSRGVAQAEQVRREYNMGKSVLGYRIRIYFDNGQQARNISSSTLESFRASYPQIPAFRTFENSYFKVTVGNYRTRTDATRALSALKASFPTAFIVEEKLKYPDF